MSVVNILDMSLANKIAAGEVVERPASVVKELVENSIDAGSTSVSIEIRDGGTSYIRISDNGCGMDEDDAKKAFLRHATSKLKSEEQLFSIATLGFRGEALASIAAVSRVVLKTRMKKAEYGTEVVIAYGVIESVSPCGCPDGTSIEVTNLFANVPARLKFMKSARAEAANISDYVLRMLLSRPDIAIRLTSSGKTIYQSRGDGSLKNAVYCAYGNEIMSQVVPVEYSDSYVRIYGYIGLESISRPSRVQQSFFINGRYIRSMRLSSALQAAYATKIMVGRYPLAIINVELAPTEVDVNVHPNKLEVRFRFEDAICSALKEAVVQALGLPKLQPVNMELVNTASTTQNDTSARNVDEENAVPVTVTPKTTETEQALCDGFERLRAFLATTEQNPQDSVQEATKQNAQVSSAQAATVATQNGAACDVQTIPEVFPPIITEENNEGEGEVEQLTLDCDPVEILCSVFDSFWLVRQGENVFIIDQHAMHERLLYESAMNGTVKTESQMLLVPIVVTLTPNEYVIFSENMELFYDLGFDIEEFGVNTLRISAVPHILGHTYDEGLLRDTIAELAKGNSGAIKDVRRDIIIKASCKAAIKLGNIVPKEMIADLLECYKKNGIPMTCPHGRPVMIVLTKKSLLKMFKRIV